MKTYLITYQRNGTEEKPIFDFMCIYDFDTRKNGRKVSNISHAIKYFEEYKADHSFHPETEKDIKKIEIEDDTIEEHRLFCALEKFRYGLLFDGSTNFQLTHNLQLLKFVLKMRRKYRAKNKMEVSQ
jgi:hypothetical protein